jgi:hypothetical protein
MKANPVEQSRPDRTKQFLNRWWVILTEIALVILVLVYAKTVIVKLGLVMIALGVAGASWALRDFPVVGLRPKVRWWKSLIFGLLSGVVYFLVLAGVQYMSTNFLGIDIVARDATSPTLDTVNAAETILTALYFIAICCIGVIFALGYFFNRLEDLFGSRHWSLPLITLTIFFGIAYPWTPVGWESFVSGLLVIPFWVGAYLVNRKNLWVPLIGFSTTVLLVFVAAILGY